MHRIVMILVFLCNLYLAYRFGIKKENRQFIAGFKKLKTKREREFIGNSIAIYLLIIDIILLLFLAIDISGISYIFNVGLWDIYFYLFMAITVLYIIFVNIYLRR